MGMVKQRLDQTPVDPELVAKIRREVSESISELAGISLEAALSVFDRSFLANTVATRPWPVLHETAEYWAQLILEREGRRIPTEV